MKRILMLCMSIAVFFQSCKDNGENEIEANEVRGIVIENMDTSVRPQDNFFKYVNGKWLANTEIPDDKTAWGVGNELADNASKDLVKLLDKALENDTYERDTDQYKAVTIYESILDTVARNNKGFNPILPYLKKIDEINSLSDLNKVVIDFKPLSSMFYSAYSFPDRKNTSMRVLYIGTGATGLPERDYYLLDDEDSKNVRNKYLLYAQKVFQKIGYSEEDAIKNAKNILEVETAMSQLKLTKEELRDARITYNPMPLKKLFDLNAKVDWMAYLKDTKLNAADTIIVSQPEYIKGLVDVFENTEIEAMKSYMRWTVINNTANLLTTDLEKTNWEFYSKELNGTKIQRPIKERALDMVNGTFGEALGQVYVDEKFPPDAKKKARRLVDNLLKAYEIRIENLDWMTEPTKVKAIEKLQNLTVKIGYPDKWKDYSEIKVTPIDEGGSLFENLLNITRWNYQDNLNKLGKEVDKSEWFMTPQTVNAYFNPLFNEIVFPAAILQPPYFNYEADMAVNYGGIGGIIGHEISHAFDDSGSRFDADGNLNNWWTDEDLAEFTKRGKEVIDQYSKLEPLPGVFVNGEFTLGENIGDLGGVKAAYDALQIDLKENGNPGEIDGFTQNERFFIAWAGAWRKLVRDEAMLNAIKTDPHSPGMYRAYMPIINMDEFHETFNTKPGDSMYLSRDERIKIW